VNLTSFNASRGIQQPRNTSMLRCKAAPRAKHGMISSAKSNINLPMQARKKTTILHLCSARGSASTHEIHPILLHIPVALNGIRIQPQPRHVVGGEGTVLGLVRSDSAGCFSRTVGDRCGAGVSDNRVNGGCWFRSGVDDDIDVAS
jgi:hypothetical protein